MGRGQALPPGFQGTWENLGLMGRDGGQQQQMTMQPPMEQRLPPGIIMGEPAPFNGAGGGAARQGPPDAMNPYGVQQQQMYGYY